MNRILSWMLVLGVFAGCGPTVKTFGPGEQGVSRLVAVLPVSSESAMARENLSYLRKSLARELRTSGFLVLSDADTDKACGGVGCPKGAGLSARYPGLSVLSLEISGTNRVNILAGYYNSIGGELTIADAALNPIMTIDHTESERGGLLFNTGQVIEGIEETVENFDSDRESALADRFIRRIVAKLPAAGTLATPDVSSNVVAIDRFEVESGGFSSTVCLTGSPGRRGALLLGRQRMSLREVRPGRYCGSVPSAALHNPAVRVVGEIRSAWGARANKSFEHGGEQICPLDRVLEVSGSVIELNCGSAGRPSCPSGCPPFAVAVFRAPSERGPFVPAGSLRTGSWKDPNPDTPVLYAVVARTQSGSSSVPVILAAKSEILAAKQ